MVACSLVGHTVGVFTLNVIFMLTKEQQSIILEEHYNQSQAFWKREKHSDLFAGAMALVDIVRTKHNPVVPNGEVLDAEVRKEVVEKHLQEFCEIIRTELETSIETEE